MKNSRQYIVRLCYSFIRFFSIGAVVAFAIIIPLGLFLFPSIPFIKVLGLFNVGIFFVLAFSTAGGCLFCVGYYVRMHLLGFQNTFKARVANNALYIIALTAFLLPGFYLREFVLKWHKEYLTVNATILVVPPIVMLCCSAFSIVIYGSFVNMLRGRKGVEKGAEDQTAVKG